ncbi:MAG: hypothetical protein DCF16_18820 [Alphaproteobacteria bacterium]|nr:MAG: hypothetical protein DCF16_18820 [Alphaproteobacteria bacterium]
MREQGYYSLRTGKHAAGGKLDLAAAKRLFLSIVREFDERGFLQNAFGYECVDAGFVPGTLGQDIHGRIFLALRKDNIWPPWTYADDYSEDDLFDVVEFVFDHIAKPTEGRVHDYSNCGWHTYKADAAAGRTEFRDEVNQVLRIYAEGYELNEAGEVFALPAESMKTLVAATLPIGTDESVGGRVEAARRKFFRYGSSIDDRRQAVRDLADVLEFLRPSAKEALTSNDESDLFNIANNFGIRHHNAKQKTSYDPAIWLSWMFYYYLATIHACVRLIEKHNSKAK